MGLGLGVEYYLCAHAATRDRDNIARTREVLESSVSIICPCPIEPNDDGITSVSVVVPSPSHGDKGWAGGVMNGGSPSPGTGTSSLPAS